jgi:hypothetical protein
MMQGASRSPIDPRCGQGEAEMSKPQRTYIQGKKADGVRQAAQDSRQEMRIAQAPQA